MENKLPPSILSAAEAAAQEYADSVVHRAHDMNRSTFLSHMKGWIDCFNHLLASAPEFDESAILERNTVIKDGIKWQTAEDYRFIAGVRWQHAQMAAQVQALREQIAYLSERDFETHEKEVAERTAKHWQAEIDRLKDQIAVLEYRRPDSLREEIVRLRAELAEARGMEQLYRQFIEGKGWECPK